MTPIFMPSKWIQSGLNHLQLLGDAGADVTLYAPDIVNGSVGNDKFCFLEKQVYDLYHTIIEDFEGGPEVRDRIYLSKSLFWGFAAVKSAASEVGADVVIDNVVPISTGTAGMRLVLKNFQLSSLVADDFVFL